MEIVKSTDDFKIVKKRSGRYGVRKSNGSWVNADEKVKILAAEGLIKLTAPAKKEEPAAEEAPAEESAE